MDRVHLCTQNLGEVHIDSENTVAYLKGARLEREQCNGWRRESKLSTSQAYALRWASADRSRDGAVHSDEMVGAGNLAVCTFFANPTFDSNQIP